jgi:hypothetical protein
MAINTTSSTSVDLHGDTFEEFHESRPRRRQLLHLLLAVAALVGALILIGVLVDPSAGAAGGCGGG